MRIDCLYLYRAKCDGKMAGPTKMESVDGNIWALRIIKTPGECDVENTVWAVDISSAEKQLVELGWESDGHGGNLCPECAKGAEKDAD